ncbi:membrane transporter [Lineolata rhizophorae]|uniref:Membrane transporter n=1 Tax=Lineolata rhizophorae TaxID=578093 RepID=A0A6A6NYS4_9PEZI|nr:membrane transporter [Lineolata rhizophorae]
MSVNADNSSTLDDPNDEKDLGPEKDVRPDTPVDLETGVSQRQDAAVDGVDDEPADPNVVWWDEPADRDPHNPMNWSARRKWGTIAILSMLTFTTPLASSMFAPGVPDVMQEFKNTNQQLATFVVSVYILGFAFGPLLVAPLSEMYGRMPLYHISNVLFVVFTVACAVSSNMSMLIGFRFLAGCVGATPVTIGGGTIADIMPQEKRGGAMAMWILGPLLGPVVGPVCGGFLVDAQGWRWVFWLLAMLGGLFGILTLIFGRETYAPALLKRKAKRLRKETGNENLRSKLDTGISHRELLARSIVRPTKMLLFSPIVASISIYVSIYYGILYLLFTTFTFVFEQQYGFSSSTVGLTYIGIGVGMFIGLTILGPGSDKILRKHKEAGREMKPEHRMPLILTVPAAIAMPVGLFIYGFTAYYHTHWIVPILGTAVIGYALMGCFMTSQTYLVDAFTVHAASALAANTVLRSIFGALLPLCGLDMYDALGLDWGNALLGFLAVALIPIPIIYWKYGERIRTSKRFKVHL